MNMLRRAIRFFLLLPLALLAACGSGHDGALDVAIVGEPENPFEEGLRLSTAGQHVFAATHEGLVSLNAEGQVIPALADQWIVTDDGRSYIFRLRDGTWPDGSALTGESARKALRRVIRQLSGTSLGFDLAQIDEVRAMAGRVVELRLKGPMPEFLQLLAQPELGLTQDGQGTGPMQLERDGDIAILTMMAPEKRGLPMVEGWEEDVRALRLHALAAREAITLFDEGQTDIVLNGRIDSLPMVETGPLSRGTVRVDPAVGLFGLMVNRAEGLLGDASGREAISMAIDRETLLSSFNIGGWQPTTRLVAPGLTGDLGTIGERWTNMDMTQRQIAAASRVATWKAVNGGAEVEISVELPEGPGGDTLFDSLSSDLQAIDVTLRRSEEGEKAELVFMDSVARYAGARWFLNQFNCRLRRGFCSTAADESVAQALETTDPAERAALLTEAEAELTEQNAFIPFGQPVRWSLVRGRVNGFSANRWVFHPLPPLAMLPR